MGLLGEFGNSRWLAKAGAGAPKEGRHVPLAIGEGEPSSPWGGALVEGRLWFGVSRKTSARFGESSGFGSTRGSSDLPATVSMRVGA